ncbi:MAG: thiol peroxidase [Gemmatimonadota bacterium]|nr:thiol peroxidase [Gemmatimonadota bacterium]
MPATHERTGEAFEEGVKLTIVGRKLTVGDRAPDFSLDAMGPGDAAPHSVSLGDSAGRVRILHVVNSLDTPVCHIGARRWESLRSASLPESVVVYTVSMDLPFALARWRGAEQVGHEALSSHRTADFGERYGVMLKEWRLLQRAVFVIDKSDRIVFAEYVGDQMQEPDYDAAVAAATKAAALRQTGSCELTSPLLPSSIDLPRGVRDGTEGYR